MAKPVRPPRFLGGMTRVADMRRLGLEALPRIAFAGRSNVGKSSLMNALTGARIARVSATPGKTREMNFFQWRYCGQEMILVDLPGYGYAKVPVSLKSQWGKEITTWLSRDEYLSLVVALVDGRHGFMKNDLELIEYLQANQIPHLVAFTKMDKWKSENKRRSAIKELKQIAARAGVERYIFVSALSKQGIRPLEDEIRSLWQDC